MALYLIFNLMMIAIVSKNKWFLILVVCFIDSIWGEFHKKLRQTPLGNNVYDILYLEIHSVYQ